MALVVCQDGGMQCLLKGSQPAARGQAETDWTGFAPRKQSHKR